MSNDVPGYDPVVPADKPVEQSTEKPAMPRPRPTVVMRPHVQFDGGFDVPDEHPLEFAYTLSYFKRPKSMPFSPEEYSDHVQPIATFRTVEQFWRVYGHLRRPSDVKDKVDFHLFKDGIKPVWEDEENCQGGKWILRLKKGLASRVWENLVLAMIGEQFMVGEEICGAVCSVRNQEDIVSLWNRTADVAGITNRIRDTMRRVLNLPPSTLLEYKRHDDCLKDQTSYRNTDIYRR
jgi:translation initiation factor 4E